MATFFFLFFTKEMGGIILFHPKKKWTVLHFLDEIDCFLVYHLFLPLFAISFHFKFCYFSHKHLEP